MANPNRALANLAKRPFEMHLGDFNKRSEDEARAEAERLKAEGWDTKVTSVRNWRWSHGPGRKHKEFLGTTWNVWKREKV